MEPEDQKENTEKTEPVPENRSVIVLSDFHCGLAERYKIINDNFEDFCTFLKKLCHGDTPDNPDVIVDGTPRKLHPPSKIILLGDIVDMWSPRDNNRASVLADSYSILRSLLPYPAEIVYVTGNHDDEIAEVVGSFPVPGIGGLSLSSGHTKLVVADRHYPPDYFKDKDGKKNYQGLRIGHHHYFFMHGHQFDILYLFVGLFQNYPGWVAKNFSLFRDHRLLKWFFWILLGFCVLYAAAGKAIPGIPAAYDSLVYFLMGLSLVICLFTFQPSTIRNFWDIISGRLYPYTCTIATVIESGYWKDGDGKRIHAPTVIFGHTHVADDSKKRYLQDFNKRFINSGSWGDERQQSTDGLGWAEKNTFLYIDADGPVLFRWPDKGLRPEQIATTLTGDLSKQFSPPTKLHLWVQQNRRGRV